MPTQVRRAPETACRGVRIFRCEAQGIRGEELPQRSEGRIFCRWSVRGLQEIYKIRPEEKESLDGVLSGNARIGFGAVFEQKIAKEFQSNDEQSTDPDQAFGVEEGAGLRTGSRRRH